MGNAGEPCQHELSRETKKKGLSLQGFELADNKWLNKWGQGKFDLVQVPCWQSSRWWVLLLCIVGTCSKFLFLHFRLLSEKQFDFFNVEDNGSDMAANEVFSKSRERSISAPDVYRCRIISGKGPLNEVWRTAWFKELQWVAKFWQALLFFFKIFSLYNVFFIYFPSSPFQCCLVLQNDHLFLQYCLGEKLGKFNLLNRDELRDYFVYHVEWRCASHFCHTWYVYI